MIESSGKAYKPRPRANTYASLATHYSRGRFHISDQPLPHPDGGFEFSSLYAVINDILPTLSWAQRLSD
jgi:hypothetical protein